MGHGPHPSRRALSRPLRMRRNAVHGLDSFGTIPLGVKVRRFAARRRPRARRWITAARRDEGWGLGDMPDAIRATGGSLQAHPRRGGFPSVVATVFLYAGPAHAQLLDLPPIDSTIAGFTGLNRPDIAGLALTFGILFFAVVTAVMLVRARSPRSPIRNRRPRGDHRAEGGCRPRACACCWPSRR